MGQEDDGTLAACRLSIDGVELFLERLTIVDETDNRSYSNLARFLGIEGAIEAEERSQ